MQQHGRDATVVVFRTKTCSQCPHRISPTTDSKTHRELMEPVPVHAAWSCLPGPASAASADLLPAGERLTAGVCQRWAVRFHAMDHLPAPGAQQQVLQLPDRLRAVGPGWHPLLMRLHKQLTAVSAAYTVLDAKEKLGGLRITLSPCAAGSRRTMPTAVTTYLMPA